MCVLALDEDTWHLSLPRKDLCFWNSEKQLGQGQKCRVSKQEWTCFHTQICDVSCECVDKYLNVHIDIWLTRLNVLLQELNEKTGDKLQPLYKQSMVTTQVGHAFDSCFTPHFWLQATQPPLICTTCRCRCVWRLSWRKNDGSPLPPEIKLKYKRCEHGHLANWSKTLSSSSQSSQPSIKTFRLVFVASNSYLKYNLHKHLMCTLTFWFGPCSINLEKPGLITYIGLNFEELSSIFIYRL